jgi:hypothetical protein
MNVRQLIAILEQLDPEGSVYVMFQPKWPFEARLEGVAVREDFAGPAEPDDAEEHAPGRDRWSMPESALPRNDVFIVVGEQVRYGDAEAWSVLRRA